MAKRQKIYVLVGTPDKSGVCGFLGEAYIEGARKAGHDVRVAYLGEMNFDPVLHHGYNTVQELEPDLKKFQEDVCWAHHVVIFYPMWWSSMPALLKGLFDRAWLPGFAFHFHEKLGWDKLLKGKSGRVIITMDSWPKISRLMFGDSTNEIGRAILGFSGIHPVRIKKIGPVKNFDENDKAKWAKKIAGWGARAR